MAKSTSKQSNQTQNQPQFGSSSSSSPRNTLITNEQIERRAYELFLARGGEHGHDVEDWLQAEREVRIGRQ